MAEAFRKFRVARKVRESEVITSFYLHPVDGAGPWPARPGQYLTLRVPDGDRTVLRTYSLSCDVEAADHHRITVKREGAGAAGQPQGLSSCWLHDQVAEGEVIEVAPPRGTFVLDEDSQGPVVLLAGGVGVTPLLSMLHRLGQGSRRVWFVQACENGAVHALRDEVAAIAAQSDGRIVARTVYRAPTEADRTAGAFDAEGLIDRAFLQALLPLDRYQVYVCGPTPFMVAMYRLLTGLGVRQDDIFYEFFGKQVSLPALAAEAARTATRSGSQAPGMLANLAFLTNPEARAQSVPVGRDRHPPELPGEGDDVVFARSGKSAVASGPAQSLLELAEEAGLEPEFSCRQGICNTCRTGLKEGRVEYLSEPLEMPAEGQVLLCCAKPNGRVVLDL